MEYQTVCSLDDIWEGEMELFTVAGTDVLIVHAPGGEVRAFHPRCPHQDQSLAEGDLDGCVLTCLAHMWEFDVLTGKGVNPTGVALTSYPVKVEDGEVKVVLTPAGVG